MRCGSEHPMYTYHGSPVLCTLRDMHENDHYAEAGDDVLYWRRIQRSMSYELTEACVQTLQDVYDSVARYLYALDSSSSVTGYQRVVAKNALLQAMKDR